MSRKQVNYVSLEHGGSMSKTIISAALFASLAIGIAHADDATDLKRGK